MADDKTASPEAAAAAPAATSAATPAAAATSPTAAQATSPTRSATRSPPVGQEIAGGTVGGADVEVDDNRDDDPGYDDGASLASGSFVSSISSSILNYKYQNGRRYHAFREGAYPVPNDDEEQERMDLGHHIYMMMLQGNLHLAPIGDNPQRVLDLGTGTGIWAMDFADQYPSAEVLGTDLSPIQPKWTPPNCTFEVDDFEQEWVYRRKFDFIHARELGSCLSDSVAFFRRAYEHIQPRGYFEFQIVHPVLLSDDDTHLNAKDMLFWLKNMGEGAAKFGKPLDKAPEYVEQIKAAGFQDVQVSIRKCPIGAWPKDPALKEIGRYQLVQEQQVIDSYTPGIFANVLGWKDDEIKVLIAKVKADLKNPANHLYLPIYFIYGQKPSS